jgi:hypothetical protein
MARARYANVATTHSLGQRGVDIIPNAEITLYDAGTTNPLVDTIYADDSGGVTLTNPFYADEDGNFEFYLEEQKRIKITVEGTGTATLTSDNEEVRMFGVPNIRASERFGYQYKFGLVDGGGFAWTSANPVVHIHQVIDTDDGGDVVGLAVEMRFDQNTGGAHPSGIPDTSAISAYVYITDENAEVATRAGEFQVILDSQGNVSNPLASTVGLEIGLHFGAVGDPTGSNYNKTGGINLIFTDGDALIDSTLQMADFGIRIWGEGGVHRPIYIRDDRTSVGVGDAFIINTVGLVYAGVSGNAGLPTYSFIGRENDGIFSPANDAVAVSTNGTERIRVDNNGLGIATNPVTGNVLSVLGPTYFYSNSATTQTLFQFGRTAPEKFIVVPGNPNEYIIGSAAGDWLFRADAGKIMFGISQDAVALIDSDHTFETKGSRAGSYKVFPQLTANQADYAPTGIDKCEYFQVDSDASRTIFGISAGQRTGQQISMTNSGAQNIVLAHESASNPTAANKINTPTGTDFTLLPGRTVDMIYNGSRWRIKVYT